MNRLERLYAISEMIRRQAPRPVSAARLAEEFEVSRRTIERDLAALRSAGVPLYAEHGRNGGQVSIDRPGNIVLTLSPPEVTALLVALAAAGHEMPFSEAGSTATKRLLDGLPDATRVAVSDLRSRIRTPIDRGQPPSNRVRRTVEQAVRRSVVVNLDYVDANGNRTTRPVEAVGFYQGGDGWYLIGWCRLRDAGRIFRLDRIQAARLTKRDASPRDVDETLGWVPDDLTAP
jgi:predicted DNA-binding transcriptional regulator YafY